MRNVEQLANLPLADVPVALRRPDFLRILSDLVGHTGECLEGVEAGKDPEALHDFRVSVRRTRSWLRVVRKLKLPVKGVRAALRGLDRVSRLTNALRDLEVENRWYRAQRSSMPSALWAEFDRFLEEANERERARKERRMAKLIRRYQANEALLRRVAGAVGDKGGRDSGNDFFVLVGEWSKRLVDRFRLIAAESPQRTVHAARIAAKRLRYVLEPFQEATLMADVVADLVNVQDLLGMINDMRAVRRSLRRKFASAVKRGAGELLREALADEAAASEVPLRRPALNVLAVLYGRAEEEERRLLLSVDALQRELRTGAELFGASTCVEGGIESSEASAALGLS